MERTVFSPYQLKFLSLLQQVHTDEQMQEINDLLSSSHIRYCNPYYHFRLIEADADDNKFVDCAIQANARYIVTQDRHYDILKEISFPKVEVIDIDRFLSLLQHLPMQDA